MCVILLTRKEVVITIWPNRGLTIMFWLWRSMWTRRRANGQDALFSFILQKITKRWSYICPVTGLWLSSKSECQTIWIDSFIRPLMRYYSNMVIAGRCNQAVSLHFVSTKVPTLLLFFVSQLFNTHISKINQLVQTLFVTLLRSLRRSYFITIIIVCIVLLLSATD
jgi:hypothetical protein